MPAGCEFICDNKECKQYRSGFNITAPWPLGRIEEIIGVLSKNPALFKGIKKEYYNKLIEYKKAGIKLACLILPNTLEIPIVGYRISFWSNKAKCVYQMDVECNGRTLAEIIPTLQMPTVCPNESCEKRIQGCDDLKSFIKTVEDGICCPFCNIKMKQDRWFSND